MTFKNKYYGFFALLCVLFLLSSLILYAERRETKKKEVPLSIGLYPINSHRELDEKIYLEFQKRLEKFKIRIFLRNLKSLRYGLQI